MRRVAFLTAGCMRSGHAEQREDHWEHEAEFEPLRAGCAARGIELEAVDWDDANLRAADYAAVVVGTTWDYTDRPDEFLAALARLARDAPLHNPPDVVHWNLDKGYLADLERAGAPIVPTVFVDRVDARTVAAACTELDAREVAFGDVVVKPRVGDSAWRQVRLPRGAPLPAAGELPPGRALVQPFLEAAPREGEYSFVFFGGRFSHCARKLPAEGDYRVQSMYGAREVVHEPSDEELELARRVLVAVPGPPLLYARVDMMRGPAGGLLLMELELVEPYLYPEQGPGMGQAFAEALERVLTG